MSLKRLLRFEQGGVSQYGDLTASNKNGRYVIKRFHGDPFSELVESNETVEVTKLLCPLEQTPIVICVGLNYKAHATEANIPVPKHPVIFNKPADSLSGPESDIIIQSELQETLDYEGELTVVTGRDAKNVKEKDALEYVLGYTAGNDISVRKFQHPEVSGGQFCYAKPLDGFSPIGEYITSTSQVPDPQNLRLLTKVNGGIKQDTNTSNMIWTVQQIIAHVSRGTTLRQGTIIMTGTPAGVGFGSGKFLRDGDIVEVIIEGVAHIKNKIMFEK